MCGDPLRETKHVAVPAPTGTGTGTGPGTGTGAGAGTGPVWVEGRATVACR